MSEVEAVRTPATPQDIAFEMYKAYRSFFGNPHPNPDSIRVLMAQWALETGWGKSMWCYNIGNAKSRPGDGYDHCFFRCNEILSRRTAERLAKESSLATITKYRDDGLCVVWFDPKHRYCRFRAFRDLFDGTYDHLKMLVTIFDESWKYVEAGDPAEYSRALKRQGYYTADERQYTRVLTSVFRKLASIELPKAPLLTEEEAKENMNTVFISLQDITEEEDIYHLKDQRGSDDED